MCLRELVQLGCKVLLAITKATNQVLVEPTHVCIGNRYQVPSTTFFSCHTRSYASNAHFSEYDSASLTGLTQRNQKYL